MSTDTRSIDWIAADNALRSVLNGCESGPLMHKAVELMLEDLRNMDPDERDDAAWQIADSAVPVYTFNRMQMLAESIHHATFEAENVSPTDNPVNLAGQILFEILHACAQNLINIIQDEF